MPNIDIDIDIDEFLWSCTRRDKEELVEALREEGFIEKKYRGTPIPSFSDQDFDEMVVKLIGKRFMLTTEEEVVITKIANRFTYESTGTKV